MQHTPYLLAGVNLQKRALVFLSNSISVGCNTIITASSAKYGVPGGSVFDWGVPGGSVFDWRVPGGSVFEWGVPGGSVFDWRVPGGSVFEWGVPWWSVFGHPLGVSRNFNRSCRVISLSRSALVKGPMTTTLILSVPFGKILWIAPRNCVYKGRKH